MGLTKENYYKREFPGGIYQIFPSPSLVHKHFKRKNSNYIFRVSPIKASSLHAFAAIETLDEKK